MWICSQIEAREHYAIPRMLHKNGQLDSLYTDFWCSNFWSVTNFMPKPFKALGNRYHDDLADTKVYKTNLNSLTWKLYQKKYLNQYQYFQDRGEKFSLNLQRKFKKRDLSHISHFFGYDTGFLEAASYCKSQGLKTVLGQMDPGIVEQELIYQERKKWPGWEEKCEIVPKFYNDRRKKEWKIADVIVVNSRWSQDALIKQGVEKEKIKIIPLAYEASQNFKNRKPPIKTIQKLKVLWLGSVILRKGIQYLLEAARSLPEIEFTIAGPVLINAEIVKQSPTNIKFLGKVERHTTEALYSSHDLFILPTLSDGFAITQIEALAHGLPVIATDKCGSVVKHGTDGLIIKSSSSEAIQSALITLNKDRSMLKHLQSNTLFKAQNYNINKVCEFYKNL
ncbi:glycosyltransferase family 4 protein [Lentisphaera marina]|uniref:glycosyltransferase family 4 protein n=1 Tax=Lentisphaera marina TaxID=1111041 RepID=UPI0023652CA1|nr:glycosyltransferase family 4 protein [Lentisphaera marina]MDD7986901.1 glycosyltransferase family 4 protein [Lentisphaera marina]